MLPVMSDLTGLKAAEPRTSSHVSLNSKSSRTELHTEEGCQALGSLEELSGGNARVNRDIGEVALEGVEEGAAWRESHCVWCCNRLIGLKRKESRRECREEERDKGQESGMFVRRQFPDEVAARPTKGPFQLRSP